MTNLYDALEVCLQELEHGADVDTVLFRYPEFAEELRPILETSVKAKSVAVPEPSLDMVRRNRAKVLQHAAVLREVQAVPSRSFWSVSFRRALVSLAVVVALFMGSTGLVSAASTTLPGDNLYPVKRTWEGVKVLFTFDVAARQALEMEHENERLEEVSELFSEGRSAEVDFAGYVTRQDGDRWLVSNIEVVISSQTDVREPSIAIGDAVRVRGVTQSDWTVLAERVDLLDAAVPLPQVDDDESEIEPADNGNENDANEDNSGRGSGNESSGPSQDDVMGTPGDDSQRREISLEGTVDSVNGNILIVDGRPMNISTAEIRGEPAAGRQAKVEGYYDANGVFIVTRIEFLDNNSDGDNSGSDDRDNDSNDNDDSDDSNDNDDHDSDNDDDGGGGDDNNNDSSGSGNGDDD